ncbi:MAG: hypothetical protein SAL07_25540 [Oscillatoria sp. PMC 1051.18]|nr:hypothetical protein [Oscillatoria sp. PMC 1050.18]MEC5033272.1 hypothetical protein [Oscillatoria sp. PMC 1051.18]
MINEKRLIFYRVCQAERQFNEIINEMIGLSLELTNLSILLLEEVGNYSYPLLDLVITSLDDTIPDFLDVAEDFRNCKSILASGIIDCAQEMRAKAEAEKEQPF